MLRSYTEYLFEKETKGNEKIVDPYFWIGNSISKILELTNMVAGLGGFNSKDPKITPMMNSIENSQKNGNQAEILNSAKSLVEYMIKKPKSEWSINGIPVEKKISIPLSDALDYILIAIEKVEKGIKNLKDYKEPKGQRDDKEEKRFVRFMNKVKEFSEKPINLDISKASEKINSTVRSLTNPEKPQSKDVFANNVRYSLKAVNDSVDSMRMLANSLIQFDKEGIESDIKELDAISEIVISNLDSLKGETLKSSDINKANSVAKEQTKKLDRFSEMFFAKYSRFIQGNAEAENIGNTLLDARKKIESVESIISQSKEARKIFKGFDRDVVANLDSKSDAIVSGIFGTPEPKESDESNGEDATNKKDRLEVNKELGGILGKEPGEYKTSIKKLKDLINRQS